jgi:hypothetical protein
MIPRVLEPEAMVGERVLSNSLDELFALGAIA